MSRPTPAESAVFRWPVRVYYEDTDAGGVVFNANYLKFMERARTERLRAAGVDLDQLARDHGVIFVIRSVELDFLRPARFNDLLQVTVEITETRAASIYFRQNVERDADVLCRGSVRIASVAAGSFRPVAVPDFLLERIAVPPPP